MKASLPLSLLLVILASTSSTTSSDDSVQPPVTSQSSSTSAQPPVTSQSSSTSAPPPVTSQSSSTSAQPPVTSPSSNTSAQSPVTSQSSSTSAQPPVTSQSSSTSAQPPVTSQSSSTSAQPPVTSQSPPGTSAPPPVTSQSSNTSAPPPSQSSNTSAPPPSQSSNTSAPPPSQSSNTSAPPPSQSSNTSAPPPSQSSNTSAPPPSQSSNTSAPPPSQSSNTSAPPPSQSSNTSAPPPSQSSNTSAQPPSQSPPGASPQQPTVTSQSPPVSSPGVNNPCEPNPCNGSSSCVKLHSKHFCLCWEGYYYHNSLCVKGKTFPGEFGMIVAETSDLEDKNSERYQEFYYYITEFFKGIFNESKSGYGQTIILKVSALPSLSARSAMRAAEKTVNVSVVNMFAENTPETEKTVSDAIRKAVESNQNMTNYVEQNLCDYYGCKKNDDNCQDALQCECKPGLMRKSLQSPFCLPLECPGFCNVENNEQCLKKSDGALECVCAPGYHTTNGKCEECPFGYSGLDCKDNFQLILTIVGTIAGAIILILLIVLIASASSKKKKKNVEEQNLIENDFQNLRLQQTGFSNSAFSNFGGDKSIFPKVRTGTPSQAQNPYANQRSVPHPDY